LDRQIAMAILKSPRTLLEAQHSSKADSESAQDITDVFVSTLRQTVSEAFERDVVRPLVALNFGAQYAERYAPSVTLNAAPRQDFAKSADAITRLWTAGYLHWSQVAETDALIGLPERDVDAFLAELEDRRAADAADRLERLKLLNPGAAARERDIVQELGDE
jgi:phage gp29-like protein